MPVGVSVGPLARRLCPSAPADLTPGERATFGAGRDLGEAASHPPNTTRFGLQYTPAVKTPRLEETTA